MMDIRQPGFHLPTQPPSSPPNAATQAKTWKAAQDFEAMTLNELMQPMFAAADDSAGAFTGGEGEKEFKPLLVNEIAKNMEHAGGLGLAGSIYEKMLAMQEKKS